MIIKEIFSVVLYKRYVVGIHQSRLGAIRTCMYGVGSQQTFEYPQHMIYEEIWKKIYELPHDKTNKMACAPSDDSAQPGHSPSLIRVFAVRMKKAWVLSYPLSAQRRL